VTSPRRAWRGLLLAACFVSAAAAAEPEAVRLRYGWVPGQVWRGTQTLTRETRLGEDLRRDRGVARFEYRVLAGKAGELQLEVSLLSQETAEGTSPLDFSPILFRALADARGVRSPSYEVAEPAPGPGELADPIQHRRVLRQVASAWQDAALWFPQLPEASLAPGKSFTVSESHEVPESQPGIAMRIERARSYRLLGVESGVARFRVEDTSRVDAAGADSGIASDERAEGEARFDLALGMWLEQRLLSTQRALISGAEANAAPGEASSHSVTEIRMERVPAEAN
jgi:hypothetical protein